MTIFVVGQEAAFNPDCPISPLLLPLDGSEPSLEAVRQGAVLAQNFKDGKPRLTLLHVIDFVLLDTAYAEGNASLVEEGEESWQPAVESSKRKAFRIRLPKNCWPDIPRE
jgi:hypothetical protein